MDCSPPGSSIHGIFQTRVLEWAAISFSRGSSRPRDRTWASHIGDRCFTIWATREEGTSKSTRAMQGMCVLSRVWLFVTPWAVAHQAPPSTEFSRLEYWNGLPFLSPGDLPDPGIEPTFPVSPEFAGVFFTTSATRVWITSVENS